MNPISVNKRVDLIAKVGRNLTRPCGFNFQNAPFMHGGSVRGPNLMFFDRKLNLQACKTYTSCPLLGDFRYRKTAVYTTWSPPFRCATTHISQSYILAPLKQMRKSYNRNSSPLGSSKNASERTTNTEE